MSKVSISGLRRAVAAALSAGGGTVSCAESCTGGVIAAALTDEPGSSAFFQGGAVAYANGVKRRLLGVPAETLAAHGAVSRETAEAMARGCLRRFGTDWALAATGIAGPGGGSREKPVGLVYLAVGRRGGAVRVFRHRYAGTRAEIRKAAVRDALAHLLAAGKPVRRRGGAALAALALAAALAGTGPVRAEDGVAGEAGGWGVSFAPRDGWSEVAEGRWMGRVGAEETDVAPLPPPPLVLRRGGNPWREYARETLSLRFGRMLRWVWSRTPLPEVAEDESFRIADASKRERSVAMELVDMESGERFAMRPEHRLRQGRIFSRKKGAMLGDVWMYAGGIEGGAVTWQVVAGHTPEGGYALLGRLASMDGRTRFFACSVGLRDDGGDMLRVTPSEPRRCRPWTEGGFRGFTFDLACTPETLNFPCEATFSLEIGGKKPAEDVPEAPAEACWIVPASWGVDAPEGETFRSAEDVFDFLRVRTSGAFRDADAWLAAQSCLARDPAGEALLVLDLGGYVAAGLLNCDPDFETAESLGDGAGGPDAPKTVNLQANRATVVLETCLRAPETDVVAIPLAMGGGEGNLDYQLRALRMSDYPAVPGPLPDGGFRAAVPLAAAEYEFFAALSRALKANGKRLWIQTPEGPVPFAAWQP